MPNPTAPTGPRPDGALKDVSAPAAGDGTPARSDWLNDIYYALLTLMDTVGVSADDSDEEFEAGVGSQFLDAMRLFAQEWAYPGLDFGLQDISGGNQASDITIYEAGGGSEKKDGFTVRLHWTGGDGTFAHTITAANTIGNEMSGFLASSAWQGDGAGELVLRLDKTNSKWLVLTPGVWDFGSFTAGDWEKYINKTFLEYGSASVSIAINNAYLGGFRNGGSSFTATFPIAFAAVPIIELTVLNGTAFSAVIEGATTASILAIFVTAVTTQGAGSREVHWSAKGLWA